MGFCSKSGVLQPSGISSTSCQMLTPRMEDFTGFPGEGGRVEIAPLCSPGRPSADWSTHPLKQEAKPLFSPTVGAGLSSLPPAWEYCFLTLQWESGGVNGEPRKWQGAPWEDSQCVTRKKLGDAAPSQQAGACVRALHPLLGKTNQNPKPKLKRSKDMGGFYPSCLST